MKTIMLRLKIFRLLEVTLAYKRACLVKKTAKAA